MRLVATRPEADEKNYRWLMTVADFEQLAAEGGNFSYSLAAHNLEEKAKRWLYTAPRLNLADMRLERVPGVAGGELYRLTRLDWIGLKHLGGLTVYCYHHKKPVGVATFLAVITDEDARQAISKKGLNQNAGTRITNPPNIWLDGDTPLPVAILCSKDAEGVYRPLDESTICFDPVAAEEAERLGTLRKLFVIRCPYCGKHKIDAPPAAFEQCILWQINLGSNELKSGSQFIEAAISLKELARRWNKDKQVWARLAEINATGIE